MLHLIAAAIVAQATATPARPPDGTYAYTIGQGKNPILTSTVVVKSNGATFDVSESVKLPNGETATVNVTWDSATVLPLQYAVHQGKVDLAATITPQAAAFTGAETQSNPALPGTKFVVVSEGLNAFRMIMPFVVKAHPGESFTVVAVNGNETIKGQATAATPPAGGPASDTVVTYDIDDEHIAAWYNPQTNVLDRAAVNPGDAWMKLESYKP